LGEKSAIEWSDTNRRKAGLGPAKEEITAIRARWKTLTNEHLQAQGFEARIDHRSLEAQGIAREPTSHLGPAVSGMERRGIETDVGKRIAWEFEASAQARRRRSISRRSKRKVRRRSSSTGRRSSARKRPASSRPRSRRGASA